MLDSSTNDLYYAGFDIGSDTVHTVVVDRNGQLVYTPESLMHFGNPLDALKEAYTSLHNNLDHKKIAAYSFTGSAGKLIAEVTDNPFYYDTISISQGAEVIAPESEYIIHLGSKDPYFFERETDKVITGKSYISDHGTGTKCGGGSGILINKQVRRFFAEEFPVILDDPGRGVNEEESFGIRINNRRKLQTQVENIHQKAKETIQASDKELDVGGRCGVIIQSDMIHMQNSGEQIQNILKGMYTRIARNFKSDVLGTRTIDPQRSAIVSGGAFLNDYLVDLFSRELGLKLQRPAQHEKIGAAGAALKAMRENRRSVFSTDNLNAVIDAQKKEIKFAPPLSSVLHMVKDYEEETAVFKSAGGLVVFRKPEKVEHVILGIDGGSTTTKALIAHADTLEIIAEICLDTDGKPLETAQKVFGEIREHLGEKLSIDGIAYTGSSGQFYHRLFTDFNIPDTGKGADFVKDEITCHANGVKHFNSDVDTIFECGGQDAKFTVFNPDGTVKKSKMNLSCMAGTGQSMKNMLDMLGFDFKTFRDYALAAKRTPVTDEMCAIFTEAGVLKLLALNFPREEIAAAIAHGFMGGYANKFVGSETFGKFASAQGGPFKGLDCLAALALHTGMEIHAFPHRQLFGAMGAAIVAFNELQKMEKAGESPVCRFRGLGIADIKFEKRVQNCSTLIEDSCGTRDCKLQVYRMGDDEIFSGGLCPKGNTESSATRSPDYVGLYKGLLNKELKKYSITPEEVQDSDAPRILIPRTLHFLNQRAVFFTSLYSALGFKVVVSPESNDEIANLGLSHSHSEACFPSKLHHGHVAYLKNYLRPGTDKMFLVNFLGQGEETAPQNQSKTCPFVSGAGFAAKEAVKLETEDVLQPLLMFEDDVYRIEDDIWDDFKRAFKGSEYLEKINRKKVDKAIHRALKNQKDFNRRIYSQGAEILNRLKKKGEKIFIGIGRGYTLFDDKANSKVHELFVANGLHFIPAFFIEQPDIDFDEIVHHMYWFQGREMTRYNLMVALDPQLYGIRETNFNCGPDAMLSYHETEIFNKAQKPYLNLQTDGHNSNAQFGTRTMANYEVVKNHKPIPVTLEDLKTTHPKGLDIRDRLMGIPNMGLESSETAAAVFRSAGMPSEVMPSKTEESEYYSRKYLITNNCLPMHILFGDAMAWVYQKQKEGYDPNKDLALLIPMAGGPCRLGQYHIITRYFLDQCGFDRVPIINPAAYLDWENIPVPKKNRSIIRSGLAKSQMFSDVIYNARLRTRPYEINKGETDRVIDGIHKELIDVIERGSNFKEMVRLMEKAAGEVKKIPVIDDRFPKVGMFGEIYVRSHTGSNEESIRKLEEQKLEVAPRLIADMMEYNNKMQCAAFWKEKRYSNWFVSKIKGLYMHVVETKFLKPFAEYLDDRKQMRPIEIYDYLRENNIFDIRIKGEAGISIGTSYMFMTTNPEDLHGVYHLEPFSCMQECVATSKIQSLIDKQRMKEIDISKKVIPYLVGVFGDSELPNIEAEMAMFAEKCYARRDLIDSRSAQ
ncbi:MAG: hypothetical protein JEY99_08690 [Spirochaetales bacterium]|nr:hypothetical protein [Spirochaetales bacterium]